MNLIYNLIKKAKVKLNYVRENNHIEIFHIN